jgi:hypothetical protein
MDRRQPRGTLRKPETGKTLPKAEKVLKIRKTSPK